MSVTIKKPQLKGLLHSRIKRALLGATIFSAVCGLVWKYTVQEPRKKAYADFKKTYDLEKKFRIMCDAGLLESCGPESFH